MPDTPAPPPAFGLPIDAALPALLAALARGNAVLAAPPGAGKTTAVPLALLDAPWAAGGRILMLEPRRLAARAAAERMAETLSEPVGATVGYRIRGEAKVGRTTRIEVVTEGILTRRLQSEPDLPGIACVIFDEIHERSIHADLGLALCLEVQDALRPELRLLAMSATLDTEAVARVLPGAEVIESAGRMYPVETRWLERPWSRPGEAPRGGARFEGAAATLIKQALTETEGDVLAFLPGRAEIERVAARLTPATEAAVLPLHASLPFAAQRKALTKTDRRRVVLATAIAETSLTVAGVRVVVDGGRARRARVNPATGMARLVTVPVSRAEADQRRGRAGRTAPGVCYRLWTRHEEGALPAFAPPEILEADLAALALDLAVWGTQDAGTLAFIDPPPPGALKEARALLHALGALDGEGRITAHGRAMDARPSHPRLAHMLLAAEANGLGGEGALLAALLGERDPWRGPRQADLGLRLRALAGGATPDLDYPTAERIRTEARRLSPAKAKPTRAAAEAGRLLAHAYPDRIGLRRPGEAPRYLLSGGRGAVFSAEDPLAATRLIVAADLDDKGREATIRLAARLEEAVLREVHGYRIAWVERAEWSRRSRRVEARSREMFGALALDDRLWRDAPAEALAAALAEGIRERGIATLAFSPAAQSLRARIAWLRAREGHSTLDGLPDWSDAALLKSLDDWLTPYLAGMTRIEDIASLDLAAILKARLDPTHLAEIERAAPAHLITPLGERARIDYDADIPTLRVRVQEVFGLDTHPTVGVPPVALKIELLSPARRPVQTTRDLPGFWHSSYRDVAKDMRARYPRHPWPDDPLAAFPTRRTKPR